MMAKTYRSKRELKKRKTISFTTIKQTATMWIFSVSEIPQKRQIIIYINKNINLWM